MHHTSCNVGRTSGAQQVRQVLFPSGAPTAPGADSDHPLFLTTGAHEAEEFDPDRFIDDRKTLHTSNPFMFLPFNAGPRICLGQQVRKAPVSG